MTFSKPQASSCDMIGVITSRSSPVVLATSASEIPPLQAIAVFRTISMAAVEVMSAVINCYRLLHQRHVQRTNTVSAGGQSAPAESMSSVALHPGSSVQTKRLRSGMPGSMESFQPSDRVAHSIGNRIRMGSTGGALDRNRQSGARSTSGLTRRLYRSPPDLSKTK